MAHVNNLREFIEIRNKTILDDYRAYLSRAITDMLASEIPEVKFTYQPTDEAVDGVMVRIVDGNAVLGDRFTAQVNLLEMSRAAVHTSRNIDVSVRLFNGRIVLMPNSGENTREEIIRCFA